MASLIGTTRRSDGAREVTYKNQPLYYYAGDQAAGDTNGEGLDAFGGGGTSYPRPEARSKVTAPAQPAPRRAAAAT